MSEEAKPRRYGVWAGHPAGRPEDKTRCVEEVPGRDGSWLHHQCSRKRGHGPKGEYCKQHAKYHEPKTA